MRVMTPRFIAAAHASGRAVVAWTINEPEEMRSLLERGVDGITTDYPDRVREVMDSMGVRSSLSG